MPRFIVTDACVLMNFINVARLDLLGQHPAVFIAPDVVADEITLPEQMQQYEAALTQQHLEQHGMSNPAEHDIFSYITHNESIGDGEMAVMAKAFHLNCGIATDDKRAINATYRLMDKRGVRIAILQTQDIVVDLINNGVITVSEANEMLHSWAVEHSFTLNISSFSELL